MKGQEIEAKFYLRDLDEFERRLQKVGANLLVPRTHELNLRFDLPDQPLTRAHRVVRLRQDDTGVYMTYKGPVQPGQIVAIRQEIEFRVSSFESAQMFLEALGYQVTVSYEKYRTTYAVEHVHVTLDVLPYGSFTELEGPDPAAVFEVAVQLGLNWQARAPESYLGIFNTFREKRGLDIQQLSFADFMGVSVSPDDLGLKYADYHYYFFPSDAA